jgi:glycine/D-amino acid oxidase-like deaminating enzyme
MTRRVAVIGAGIMGGATALFLARRGVEVVLFEAAPAPFAGASRWNEGKIHLGFLYAADPSLRTKVMKSSKSEQPRKR